MGYASADLHPVETADCGAISRIRQCAQMATTFGERLRAARERAGMTQDALASASGVKVGTVYRYEKDSQEPRLGVIQSLADALDCDAGWLVSGESLGHEERDDVPPNLARFLQTELGQTVTDDQRATLLAMVKHYSGDTSVAGWRTAYTGLFEMAPDPAPEPTDEELGGLMKVDR